MSFEASTADVLYQPPKDVHQDRITIVSFQTELLAVYEFVEKAKEQLGDRFFFEESIDSTAFMVPFHSVSEMIKKTVEHGLEDIEEAFTVKLTVKELERDFEITIEDNNGDVRMSEATGRPIDHRILDLVSIRFRDSVNGTVSFRSNPWIGTVVKIMIPKSK